MARLNQYTVGKDHITGAALSLKGCVIDAQEALDSAELMPKGMLGEADRKEMLRRIRMAKAKLTVIAKLIKS